MALATAVTLGESLSLYLNINLELADLPTTASRELIAPSKLRSWDMLRC